VRSFNTYIEEGVHDPGIFKAFFTAGGPGSGKSFVAGKGGMGGLKKGRMLMSPFGLKIVNSDPVYEKLLKDAGLQAIPKDISSKRGQAIRDVAKGLVGRRQGGWVEGRLGLLIDGTGKDYRKIQKLRGSLDDIGYDTYMLFVNTSLDVALQRNEMRTRKLDATDVENMWKAVQENMGKFQLLFGRKNFILIDNNSASEDVFDKLFVQIKTLVDDPVTSKAALAWIRSQLPD
jgi:dephospho-CoA kinase